MSKKLVSQNNTTAFTNVTAATNNVDINLSDVDQISAQINIVDSATTIASFIDGVRSTGTVTVTDFSLAAGTVVTVDGTALTEGVDWTAETSNDVTADNLAVAIDAIAAVTAANPAAAIITVRGASVGTAGNVTTTVTGTGVTVQQATLAGGLNSDVVGTPAFSITETAHGYSTGLKVNYDVVGGTTIDNLVDNTDYFVIKVDANTVQLATSEANAIAGTEIQIDNADNAVGGGSFTLTPTALDVDVTVQGSNDGTNFTDVSSSTATTNGVTLFAIPEITFAYLKVIVEPNDSEADVVVTIHTKL